MLRARVLRFRLADAGRKQLEFGKEAQVIRRNHRVRETNDTPSVTVVEPAEDTDCFQVRRRMVNIVDNSLNLFFF